jgi:hypothetical protein
VGFNADGGRGSRPGLVHKIHRVLSMVLGLAVKDGRIPRNPAADVNLPRATKADKRYLRPEQVTDLAHAAGSGRLVVLALAYTGLRWGELAALTNVTGRPAPSTHPRRRIGDPN